MSNEQQIQLDKVRKKLKEAREMLDDVVYRMMSLSDNEFKKVRACYDKICEANDQI